MVRKLGNLMSINSRLNQSLSNVFPSDQSNLSCSTSTMSLCTIDARLPDPGGNISCDQVRRLCEQLAECQAQLAVRDRHLKRVRVEQEEQLSTLCRQMMSFECGLRRKERELKSSLQQKERLIKEQAAVIRFLLRKKEEGVGKKNIGQLHDEAQAKIPQVVPQSQQVNDGKNVTTICINGRDVMTTITEKSDDNSTKTSDNDDSDSAILVDDSNSSGRSSLLTHQASSSSSVSSSACATLTSTRLKRSKLLRRRISRSVSDVLAVSMESDENRLECSSSSASSTHEIKDMDEQFRGFLLRHGSFERFKMKSLSKQHQLDSLISDDESVPSQHHHRTGLHLHGAMSVENLALTEVNTKPGLQGINHRSVMKPRDVKNRSTKIRNAKNVIQVEKIGSVYRTLGGRGGSAPLRKL